MRFDVARTCSLRPVAVGMVIAAMLFMTACAETQTGVRSGARSQYDSIAVIPRVNDRLLSVYWSSPIAQPAVSEASMGWSATRGVGQMSREILRPIGTSVTVVSNPTSAGARATQAAIVLQQTPLDALARNYDPGRDLECAAKTGCQHRGCPEGGGRGRGQPGDDGSDFCPG